MFETSFSGHNKIRGALPPNASKVQQGPGSVDYISDLAWSCRGVEPAELWELAENREVFWNLPRAVPPRQSRDDKQMWEVSEIRITVTIVLLQSSQPKFKLHCSIWILNARRDSIFKQIADRNWEDCSKVYSDRKRQSSNC